MPKRFYTDYVDITIDDINPPFGAIRKAKKIFKSLKEEDENNITARMILHAKIRDKKESMSETTLEDEKSFLFKELMFQSNRSVKVKASVINNAASRMDISNENYLFVTWEEQTDTSIISNKTSGKIGLLNYYDTVRKEEIYYEVASYTLKNISNITKFYYLLEFYGKLKDLRNKLNHAETDPKLTKLMLCDSINTFLDEFQSLGEV